MQSVWSLLSEFYIALFSGGQDLEPDRETVICLGHGSILWSGSELSISKTRKPICGYLSVERQEVNKVVSLCSDPVFHHVHILLNRNMTNLKILTQKTVQLWNDWGALELTAGSLSYSQLIPVKALLNGYLPYLSVVLPELSLRSYLF